MPHTCTGANRGLEGAGAIRQSVSGQTGGGISYNGGGLALGGAGADAIRQSVSGQTVSGISYNGVALTLVDAATIAGELRAELWRLIAPATGAHNIVVTLDNTAKFVVHGCSYTGGNQTTPHGAPAKG